MKGSSPVITWSAVTRLQLILQQKVPSCPEVAVARPRSRGSVIFTSGYVAAVQFFHARGQRRHLQVGFPKQLSPPTCEVLRPDLNAGPVFFGRPSQQSFDTRAFLPPSAESRWDQLRKTVNPPRGAANGALTSCASVLQECATPKRSIISEAGVSICLGLFVNVNIYVLEPL